MNGCEVRNEMSCCALPMGTTCVPIHLNSLNPLRWYFWHGSDEGVGAFSSVTERCQRLIQELRLYSMVLGGDEGRPWPG
jgi:hypothetical protein